MRDKQLQWFAAYSCAATTLIALLAYQSSTQSANAQTTVPRTPQAYGSDTADHAQHRASNKDACKASDIIGMDVRTVNSDEAVGSINDLMIGHDGRVNYAAVSFGGFLGMGDKMFAVPMNAIEFMKVGEGDDAETYARIDVTEQTLKNHKGFDQDHWPEEADRGFLMGNQERVGQTTTGQINQ